MAQYHKNQSFRQERAPLFRSNGNGTFGGYKKGVQNGPASSSPRAVRRQQKTAVSS